MGREATCRARLGDRTSTGKALLETSDLLFRGDFRVVVPFTAMTSVSADESDLTVSFTPKAAKAATTSKGGKARKPPVETLVLELGDQAVKWAARIRNPPTRLDKLGVKATSTVALLDGDRAPAGSSLTSELRLFTGELEARGAKLLERGSKAHADLVFLPVEKRADLRKLPSVVPALRSGAALWVLRPKGSEAITEADVRNAGRSAGLVDVKVAAFSRALTAEKFVVPVAARQPKP